MEFTLARYLHVIERAQSAGYAICSVADHFRSPDRSGPLIVLRHDVDRLPRNALDMARLEARRGVRATYYFRVTRSSWNEPIIREIADLGHEIGYHYEDWRLANGDPSRAADLFARHLARFRDVVPVETVAMHGSPFSRESNLTIWDFRSPEEFGVRDCVLSGDWSDFVFFTDTGRTFAPSGVNLRDHLGAARLEPAVTSSDSLAEYLGKRRAALVHLSAHPERWTGRPLRWAHQWLRDQAANGAKRIIRAMRKNA